MKKRNLLCVSLLHHLVIFHEHSVITIVQCDDLPSQTPVVPSVHVFFLFLFLVLDKMEDSRMTSSNRQESYKSLHIEIIFYVKLLMHFTFMIFLLSIVASQHITMAKVLIIITIIISLVIESNKVEFLYWKPEFFIFYSLSHKKVENKNLLKIIFFHSINAHKYLSII